MDFGGGNQRPSLTRELLFDLTDGGSGSPAPQLTGRFHELYNEAAAGRNRDRRLLHVGSGDTLRFCNFLQLQVDHCEIHQIPAFNDFSRAADQKG